MSSSPYSLALRCCFSACRTLSCTRILKSMAFPQRRAYNQNPFQDKLAAPKQSMQILGGWATPGTTPQSANNQINEHTISSEKAVSICREDLQRTFPHKSFTLDSVSGVDNHRITVVLADGGPSQNAIPYNRYHFVVDTQRWTILSESIEIIEDMVIVDTPSFR